MYYVYTEDVSESQFNFRAFKKYKLDDVVFVSDEGTGLIMDSGGQTHRVNFSLIKNSVKCSILNGFWKLTKDFYENEFVMFKEYNDKISDTTRFTPGKPYKVKSLTNGKYIIDDDLGDEAEFYAFWTIVNLIKR
ncbi:hypothetical protein BI036_gp025 [Morganella phage vB_MmoM_MP1]|uniref:Uncharacterized protein n=1 Tax=Morganella phage vB_MmoM_MP1 TaxID=1852628 RepID=A0A192YAG7_9CAUD|nr:hypothetical protein BI036_gp025 [Morganella phage vB_MmoM_MP1]ANM46532.1 hypothetical protein MP1_gp0025 [Morganella phage vB_MmoM_MP1]